MSTGEESVPSAENTASAESVPSAESGLLLPLLPLKNAVLFPQQLMPLSIGRPASLAAVEAALATEDKTLAVATQLDGSLDEPGFGDLFEYAALAILKRVDRNPAMLHAIVQGDARVKLLRADQTTPYLRVRAVRLPVPTDVGPEVDALFRELQTLANRVFTILETQTPPGLSRFVAEITEPMQLVHMLGSVLSFGVDQEKRLLAANTRLDALRLADEFMRHEVQVLELRQKIASKAETELNKQQREYLLRQQMQAIRQELGESSPEQEDVAEVRERLAKADLPEAARVEVERALTRLERMSAAAADYQVTRTHVELVLELPWKATTADNLDLKRAREILDHDHYDLEEVKERIVEQLAVLKLNPRAKAPILCFVGPPGVGKTSLGQSIARALGRKFERQSLGGMHDEAELRGHRRTYIGAMPGRLIQALRRAGVRNPLLMLDEIDKLGRDFRGDPASALLEILDPAQNFEFRDNYLDLPFDLSQVFFITTANTLQSVPQPLLDRMEVLRLSGYTDEEKEQIARRYLIPRQIAETGLSETQFVLDDDALRRVIRRYTREAGVRELERMIGRLARKVAARVAADQPAPERVRVDDLVELLGAERFFVEALRRQSPPGVAAGLAWTEAGGDVLYVEAVLLPESSGMTLTGQLGEVMRESAKAAQSFILSHADQLGLDAALIRKSGVHVHVPSGAIPKDGPSAGVTLAAALTSLYRGAPARGDTAMTGEITLSGLVLPVGGIKEKVLAARRGGFTRVVLPKENEKDLRDIPEPIRRETQFVFAEHVEQVLAAALPSAGAASAGATSAGATSAGATSGGESDPAAARLRSTPH